jgi:hypothetical protein
MHWTRCFETISGMDMNAVQLSPSSETTPVVFFVDDYVSVRE